MLTRLKANHKLSGLPASAPLQMLLSGQMLVSLYLLDCRSSCTEWKNVRTHQTIQEKEEKRNGVCHLTRKTTQRKYSAEPFCYFRQLSIVFAKEKKLVYREKKTIALKKL